MSIPDATERQSTIVISPRFWQVVTICSLLAIVPVWIVDFPPATDLPQHLSQMVLLEWTTRDEALLIAPWYYPNTAIYLPIYVFWSIFDPDIAGKLVLSLILTSSLFASAWLCARFGRPSESWLLTLPLVFNACFYWGFLNFLSGWPVYCFFLLVTMREYSIRQTLAITGLLLVLYWCHALWFVCAAATLGLCSLHDPRRCLLPRALAVMPTTLMAAIWYPHLVEFRRQSSYSIAPVWRTNVIDRLSIDALSNAALGGIPNSIEMVAVLAILGWVSLAIAQYRSKWVTLSNTKLLAASLLLLAAYLLLPTKMTNTILFNSRWLPYALTLLALASPRPSMPALSTRAVKTLLFLSFALFVMVTSRQWLAHERDYMSGFREALARVSKNDRLLGLAYFQDSPYVGGAQQMQAFAWAQAIHHANINFSFAQHHSGLVNYRTPRSIPWRGNLEWAPANAQRSDVVLFDKILVSGDDFVHEQYSRKLGLRRLTPEDPNAKWHLYQPAP